MPRQIFLPRQAAHDASGISLTWTKTAQRLDISGWFDQCCGIEGDSLTLREFFDLLGITEKDCAAAWRKPLRENI
jgi:hypothetical protein